MEALLGVYGVMYIQVIKINFWSRSRLLHTCYDFSDQTALVWFSVAKKTIPGWLSGSLTISAFDCS